MSDAGSVSILNVGVGDTKLTFDKGNPAERIRAARIVRDMIRRGYALLVEVDDGKGGKVCARATDFDENTCEYIIADFDPLIAAEEDRKEGLNDGPAIEAPREETPGTPAPTPAPRKRGRPVGVKSTKRVDAGSTRTVAVAPSAGG